MGLFNFGGSKQSSKSQSTQLGVGYGYNGSTSDSFSQGASRSVSGGESTQSLAFEDLFQQLYGNAGTVAGKLAGQAGGLTEQANMLFSGGLGFLDQLGGGADTDYLASRVAGGNPLLDEQIGALGDDIGRFFSEEINPAITSQHVAGGTLGGGRQGVAQGAAAAAAGREFQTGATNLRVQDLALRDAAAAQLQGGRIAGASAGLGALPGLFETARGGFGAELAPYQALAGIMGGPTTLSQSSQFSTASSEDIARAISEAFGENFSYDYGQATSSSKSKSISLGF